jgi:hypothetical protein
MSIQINLGRIQDPAVRSSLEHIQDEFNAAPLNLGGFQLYTITTTGAVTNRVMTHNLGFIPKDLIVTRTSGGTVTWAYDSFTSTTITFTTSAAVNVRFLLGSMENT